MSLKSILVTLLATLAVVALAVGMGAADTFDETVTIDENVSEIEVAVTFGADDASADVNATLLDGDGAEIRQSTASVAGNTSDTDSATFTLDDADHDDGVTEVDIEIVEDTDGDLETHDVVVTWADTLNVTNSTEGVSAAVEFAADDAEADVEAVLLDEDGGTYDTDTATLTGNESDTETYEIAINATETEGEIDEAELSVTALDGAVESVEFDTDDGSIGPIVGGDSTTQGAGVGIFVIFLALGFVFWRIQKTGGGKRNGGQS